MDYKEAVRYGVIMGVIFALFDGGLIYDVIVSWGDWSIIWKSALAVIDTVIAVLYFKSAVSAYKKNKKLIENIAELQKFDAVEYCANDVAVTEELFGLKKSKTERINNHE